jgi:hypothetical protein
MRIVIMEMVPLRLRFLPSRSRYSVLEVEIEERKGNSSGTNEIRAGVDVEVDMLRA